MAARVAEDFDDGVRLVEFASLSDPDLVSQAVASALGVREVPGSLLVEALSDHLGSKRLLLVLDNCEHLVDACADLAVPPLSLPDPRHLSAADGLSG